MKNYFDKKKLTFSNDPRSKFNSENLIRKLKKKNNFVDFLDSRYECIIEIKSVDKNFPKKAISELEKYIRVGEKPVRISKRVLGKSFSSQKIYIGVLLANRISTLPLIDYEDFCKTIKKTSKKFNLIITEPSFDLVRRNSKKIEKNINELDVKLALTLLCPNLPSIETFRAFMSTLGILEYSSGRFLRLCKNGDILFSVLSGDSKFSIIFLLDLPRTKNPEEVFLKMFNDALWLSRKLGGRISDDIGNFLDESDKSKIKDQLIGKVNALKKAGLQPGSDLSLKIFC